MVGGLGGAHGASVVQKSGLREKQINTIGYPEGKSSSGADVSSAASVIFFANTEWYLYNFRSALLRQAREVGFKVRCVSPPGEYGRRLTDAGFAWRPLPFERGSRVAMVRSLWRTRPALGRLMVRESPAIVHSFTLTSILLTWLALPRASGIRRVNAVTGMGYAFTGASLKHRLLRAVLSPLIRRALGGRDAWTVVQNPVDREIVIRQFEVVPERVRLIPGSGVDIERFRPREDCGPDSTLRVGFVGRLLHDKGIREFVRAAAMLKSRFPNVRFVAAGAPDAGNPASVSEQELRAWKASGEVEFLGQVGEMPEFLRSLDVFVLPSYREGLSRSLIEAGASGVPAVTTDVPGCRDVVGDGDNGLLVPARDAEALAQSIAKLLESDELRRRMAGRARQIVAERFSNDVINSATLELYREMLGGVKEPHSGRMVSR